MPFGLCNAPATFQRLMEHVLTGLCGSCPVYLDDIINVQQHLKQLRDVFVHLKVVKPANCHLLLQGSVCYLGHFISDRGIETDPEKGKCVADWPVLCESEATAIFYGSCLI